MIFSCAFGTMYCTFLWNTLTYFVLERKMRHEGMWKPMQLCLCVTDIEPICGLPHTSKYRRCSAHSKYVDTKKCSTLFLLGLLHVTGLVLTDCSYSTMFTDMMTGNTQYSYILYNVKQIYCGVGPVGAFQNQTGYFPLFPVCMQGVFNFLTTRASSLNR